MDPNSPSDDVTGGEATTTPGKRGRTRDSLLLLANVRIDGSNESLSVRVRNLSAGGLMAELSEPIDPDAPVTVEVRGIGWVPGRVAWQAEGRAGIAFDKPIDPQKARKPVGRGTRTPAYAKSAVATFRGR